MNKMFIYILNFISLMNEFNNSLDRVIDMTSQILSILTRSSVNSEHSFNNVYRREGNFHLVDNIYISENLSTAILPASFSSIDTIASSDGTQISDHDRQFSDNDLNINEIVDNISINSEIQILSDSTMESLYSNHISDLSYESKDDESPVSYADIVRRGINSNESLSEFSYLRTISILPILPDTRINMVDKDVNELLLKEINSWGQVLELDNKIIDILSIALYEKKIPNINYVIKFIRTHSCNKGFIESYTYDEQIKSLKYFLSLFGRMPKNLELNVYMEFYHMQQPLPTLEEFHATLNRLQRLQWDPVEFHNTEKVFLPTENLERLQPRFPEVNEHDLYCVLCQENIINHQLLYELTPCKHKFHANSDTCIESNIIEWLGKHKTCPTCRREIIIS